MSSVMLTDRPGYSPALTDDPPAAALSTLTPQDWRIARLAAAGLTNREIGEQLLISRRTVGSHLYHLFPKLEITARAQLADALALLTLSNAPR
jgi:DNA-binding NarL/FixJ family response regulator